MFTHRFKSFIKKLLFFETNALQSMSDLFTWQGYLIVRRTTVLTTTGYIHDERAETIQFHVFASGGQKFWNWRLYGIKYVDR